MKASLLDYKFANVLMVSAHFDDEALFCGGTLRRMSDNHCNVAVAVTASVTVTNQPRDIPERVENESNRQQRRLVAFGRSCGMMNVSRVFLLDGHNCRGKFWDEPVAIRQIIQEEITERLAPVIADVQPDVVITHGYNGEYGHGQHILTHRVVKHLWKGPLWCINAKGPLLIPIDRDFKKRLLDCYRYGTTQDAYWTPYLTPPGELDIGPWLNDREGFMEETMLPVVEEEEPHA